MYNDVSSNNEMASINFYDDIKITFIFIQILIILNKLKISVL